MAASWQHRRLSKFKFIIFSGIVPWLFGPHLLSYIWVPRIKRWQWAFRSVFPPALPLYYYSSPNFTLFYFVRKRMSEQVMQPLNCFAAISGIRKLRRAANKCPCQSPELVSSPFQGRLSNHPQLWKHSLTSFSNCLYDKYSCYLCIYAYLRTRERMYCGLVRPFVTSFKTVTELIGIKFSLVSWNPGTSSILSNPWYPPCLVINITGFCRFSLASSNPVFIWLIFWWPTVAYWCKCYVPPSLFRMLSTETHDAHRPIVHVPRDELFSPSSPP